MEHIIGILGAPISGKCTILRCLAQSFGVKDTLFFFEGLDPISTAVLPFASPLTIYAPCGVSWHKEKVTNWILEQASVVVYVIAAICPDSAELTETYFALHQKLAVNHKKHWHQVPWVTVINKIDLGGYIPTSLNYPNVLEKEAIRTNALTGEGVDLLIERFSQLLSQ